MPVTLEQVRAALEPEEPNYASAAQLGPDAMPYLMQLVQGDDPMLAAKAAYLASLIQSDQTEAVLMVAARSAHDTVRAAVAAGVRNLGSGAAPLLNHLLRDSDVGVRKVALRSIVALPVTRARTAQPLTGIKATVEEIAQHDPEPLLRQLAGQIAAQLP
jgi:hypothetical protein